MGIKGKLATMLVLAGILPAIAIDVALLQKKKDLELSYESSLREQAVGLGDVIDRNLFERYGDVQAFGVYQGNPAVWIRERVITAID